MSEKLESEKENKALKELRYEIEKGWDGSQSSRSVADIIAVKSENKSV